MPGSLLLASDGFAPVAASLTPILLILNTGLFGYLAVRFWRARSSVRSQSLRSFLTLRTGIMAVVVIGSVQRLAMDPRWSSPQLSGIAGAPGQVALSVFAGVVLVSVAVSGRRLTIHLARAEAFYRRSLKGPLPVNCPQLSSREREVVKAIRAGFLSDRELASRLHISASTAGTHVRNIMRKAGITDRRLISALDTD